jgi:hypothetical protein
MSHEGTRRDTKKKKKKVCINDIVKFFLRVPSCDFVAKKKEECNE